MNELFNDPRIREALEESTYFQQLQEQKQDNLEVARMAYSLFVLNPMGEEFLNHLKRMFYEPDLLSVDPNITQALEAKRSVITYILRLIALGKE